MRMRRSMIAIVFLGVMTLVVLPVIFVALMAVGNPSENVTQDYMHRIHAVKDIDRLKQTIINTKGITVVSYSAKWCSSCKIFKPVLEQLIAENKGAFDLYIVDVDDHTVYAIDNDISIIPYTVIYKNGEKAIIITGPWKIKYLRKAIRDLD